MICGYASFVKISSDGLSKPRVAFLTGVKGLDTKSIAPTFMALAALDVMYIV